MALRPAAGFGRCEEQKNDESHYEKGGRDEKDDVPAKKQVVLVVLQDKTAENRPEHGRQAGELERIVYGLF